MVQLQWQLTKYVFVQFLTNIFGEPMTRISNKIQLTKNQDSFAVSNDNQSKKTVFSRQPHLPKNFFQRLAKMLFQIGNPKTTSAVNQATLSALDINIKSKLQGMAATGREKIQNNSTRSVVKTAQKTELPAPAEKIRSEFLASYKYYLEENRLGRSPPDENEIKKKMLALDSQTVDLLSGEGKLNNEALKEIFGIADDIQSWLAVIYSSQTKIQVGQKEIDSHEYFKDVSKICETIKEAAEKSHRRAFLDRQ